MKKSLLLMLFLALTWSWTAQAETLTFDFSKGIPSDWDNSGTYPWVVVTEDPNGNPITGIKSSNSGVSNSNSMISATFTFLGDGSITFHAGCWGEGTSSIYDKCIFIIDGTTMFQYGALQSWATYSFDVDAGEHTFVWNYSKDGSVNATGDAFFLDNVVVDLGEAGALPKPTGLAVSGVTDHSAVLSWTENGTATAWKVAFKAEGEADFSEVNAGTIPFTLDGLSPLTAYTVKVCAVDGKDSPYSTEVQFSTTAVAVTVGDSWSDNFEGASCGWELINGSLTNKWAWGTATSNGGTHSLYISDDDGVSNNYSGTYTKVFAAKLLNFTDGKFSFSYDWKCKGESNYDFLRVALVPASQTLTAGSDYSTIGTSSLPTGWIALDGGGKLNLQETWQNHNVAINVVAGNYYLVFAWRDDSGSSYNPPAAVDNVSITKIACEYDVAGLAVANITTDAAQLSWTAGEASEWQVAYSTSNSFEGATEEIVSEASYQIGGLDPATTYYVRVRAHCDGEDFGAWSEVISFVTECVAINLDDLTNGWTENFDSYTASSGFLPICWSRINEGSSSYYNSYPYVYGYGANSTSNCLYFYTYGSSSTTTIDDQYAILPEMDGLDGKQITLWAKGYNASSTFKIGLISDPADVTTFAEIAEQELTTSYQEFTYNIQGSGRIAIMMPKPKSSSSVYRGVYIDDISIHEAPSCEKPIELAVEGNGQTATFTWTSDAGAFEIAHATSATADPEENIAGDATENSFVMSDLALDEDHYFWVRSDCGSDGKSIWAGPVSVHIGYCVPTPSNVDGNGISNVTFGTGDNIVNNTTPKATYGDFHAQVGDIQAGVESTIAITYATGYTYGTLIWVDLDNSLTFDDDEILYMGTSTNANPTTLNAMITIPADQALGQYRMRIGGADSGFDSYISDPSTAAPSACYTGNWACFQDYTINILEAPSCLTPTGLAVEYNGGTEATISWTSDASSFNMKVNGTPIDAAINSPSYVLGGLELATTYSIEVQANCGTATSDWTSPVSFTTDLCLPADMCAINYSLTDQYDDSWNGASIKVKDVVTDEIIATIAMPNVTGPYIGSFTVCDGRAIQFVWSSGSYDSECRYTFTDIQGQEIFSGSGAMSAPVDYTVDCPSCFKPKELAASNIASSTADLSWTAGASETQWVLQYSEDSEFASAVSETIDDNPSFQLTGLEPEHTYYVRVKAVCGSDDESDWVVLAEPITTLAECPVPSSLAVADVLANSAKVSWAGSEYQTFNILMGQDNPNNIKSYDFATGIPSDFENDATYPWTIASYAGGACIQSSNAGVASSASTISVTVTYPAAGTIDFDAQCMGEGTSTAWDKCSFSIDNTEKFAKGANGGQWDHYSFDVAAGEHTFSWTYSKDGSVNATGDHFAVANIVMGEANVVWETTPIENINEREYSMTNLEPETHYFVKVQGDCSGTQTEWSDVFDFFTLPTQQVVITSAGYATYYNAYAYEMPADVIGYAFADKHYVQAYVAGQIVAAQQPLVLQGEAGIYDLLPTNATPDNTPEENQLIGVLSETFVADETGYKFYVLSLNAAGEAGSAGFYWYNADGSGDFTVPAHKAYLKLSDAEANNAPGFIFDENGATSLENLKGVVGTLKFIQDGTIYILREGVIYDATGRKVRTLE